MRKLAKLATLAVAAVMTVSMAFAGNADDFYKDGTLTLFGDGSYLAANELPVDAVESVTFHVELNEDQIADEAQYYHGGAGFNSTTTGWAQIEWAQPGDEVKPITVEGSTADITISYELLGCDAPVDGTDEWLQAWIQGWDSSEFTVTGVDVKVKGGDAPAETPDAPAEDAPATDNAPATGDATSVIALGAVALLALAGVAFTKKNA